MNAYELADELQELDAKLHLIVLFKSAEMLRQQADRIAELEKEKKTEPFIWLKQDFDGEWIEVFPNKGIPLYTTPQTKPLSDEEIKELIVNKVTDYELCRAIEERHGIK